MELRERLQRLGYTSAAPAGTSPRPSAFPPPAVKPRTRSPWGVEAVVGGDEVESEHGRCFVARGEWDDEYRHGASAVGEYRSLPTGARGWLWRAARATLTDPGRVAFVDTETTGLAGGTGTYVFLVGVGRFVGGGFRLRQFFMRDYSEERPLLQALARELRDVDAVVTFNGKAFDVPLIETRYAMHRLPPPLQDADHLDLLFPARRLWRTRLDRCNLGTLESAVIWWATECR